MSMFICARCDAPRDADDGCEEGADGVSLICPECVVEREERAMSESERAFGAWIEANFFPNSEWDDLKAAFLAGASSRDAEVKLALVTLERLADAVRVVMYRRSTSEELAAAMDCADALLLVNRAALATRAPEGAK